MNNRVDKTTYSNEPSELTNIPSSLISDDVVDREKAIYGANKQKDYSEIEDPDILNVANSVAAVIEEGYLVRSRTGFQISRTCPTLGTKYHLCSKESYFDQQVPSVCTAFVVAPDVIATAGHCVPLLGSSRIVFGFRNEKNSGQVQIPALIPASQVYRSGQILARKYDPAGADYALVRVDRPMTGHLPLKLHTDGDIARGTFVYVLGHPSGLPEKLADGAIVNDVVPNGYFISNLDTFGGNSGSPVFNQATNTVEGILARGGRDYGPSGNCNVSFICPVMPDGTKDCRGESATLMSQLSSALKSLGTDSTTTGDKGTTASKIVVPPLAIPPIVNGGAPTGAKYQNRFLKNNVECLAETVKVSATNWEERNSSGNPAACDVDTYIFKFSELESNDTQNFLLYDEGRNLFARIPNIPVGQTGPSDWRLASSQTWNVGRALTRVQ